MSWIDRVGIVYLLRIDSHVSSMLSGKFLLTVVGITVGAHVLARVVLSDVLADYAPAVLALPLVF